MKRQIKKMLALTLSLVMTVSMATVQANSASVGNSSGDPITFNSIYDNHTDDPTAIIESGLCGADENGENVHWELKESGELYVYGRGSMADYDSMNDVDSPFLHLSAPVDKIIVENGVTVIGKEAFYYLVGAREVILPDGLEKISDEAFLACNAVKSISIPSTVTEIGKHSIGFSLSNGKYGSYNNRSEFIVIGFKDSAAQSYSEENELMFQAVDDDTSSDHITTGQCGEKVFWTFNDITNHLDVYGEGETFDCESFRSPFEIRTQITETSYSIKHLDIDTVTVDDGVTSIGSWMFYDCEMKSISLPSTLKSIHYQAFRDCEELLEIDLPDGLEEISSYAFNSCEKMRRISIPSSVYSISEEYVFGRCYALEEIRVDENNSDYEAVNGCLYTKGCEKLLCIPQNIQTKKLFINNHTEIDNNYYAASSKVTPMLETIVYPEGFKAFGEKARYLNSPSLKHMIFQGDVPAYSYYDASSFYDQIFYKPDEMNIYCSLSNSDWKTIAEKVDPDLNIYWIDLASMSRTLSASIDKPQLRVGESAQIYYSLNPAVFESIVYSSSNENSVIVSSKGKVLANKPGSAELTVKTSDGSQSVKLSVTVSDNSTHCPEHDIFEVDDDVFIYDRNTHNSYYSQYTCEKLGGIYIFSKSALYFYSFDNKTHNKVTSFNNVTGVYFANDILYIGTGRSVIVYDLITQEIKREIQLENVYVTAVGADKSGRIYAGVYDDNNTESYRIILLSPEGELLSQTYCGTRVYRFYGFDSTNGRFYTENDYDYYSWGYNHPGYGLNMGVVVNNDIKWIETSSSLLEQGIISRGFSCILYLGQDVYYDHNTYASLLGDHYLTAITILSQQFNIYDSNAEKLSMIMSKERNVPEFEHDSSWTDYESIGVRAVWNEKNDSIIMYENGNHLVEFNPETGEKIAYFDTAHPVFNLMNYKDGLVAVEKDQDKYYLEFIRWNYEKNSLSIIADNNRINVGDSKQLTVQQSNGMTNLNYVWCSSNNTIASVSKTGKITAWNKGVVTISCKTITGDLSAEITINVDPITVPEDCKIELNSDVLINNNVSANTYTVWSNVVNSYLIENSDGSITRIDGSGENTVVENFTSDHIFKDSIVINDELPIFGGFFNGKTHNYLVFGKKNENESDETEVMRVVKYSKDWKRLSSYSLFGANTYIPFDAGSLRMTETDGKLYIHTCHEMYAEEDDTVHHQANMTYVIDQANMTLLDSYYDVYNFSIGYVSHSFNQFIATDGNEVFRVDHGDASPRAVAITRFSKDKVMTDIHGLSALEIPGGWGTNSTGVSVGGFSLSENNCLIAGNSTDRSDLDNYSYYGIRNVFLIVVDKKFENNELVWLTDYKEDSTISVGTPQLVELGNDHYLMMWEETNKNTNAVNVLSSLVDGDGRIISKREIAHSRLSDCQPIFTSENTVKWYVTDGEKLTFYSINPFDTEDSPISRHHEVVDPKIEPTCTEVGYTQGSHCDICGVIIKEQKEIPATGHDYSLGNVTWVGNQSAKAELICKAGDSTVKVVSNRVDVSRKEPTCDKEGTAVYTAYIEYGGKTYTTQKTEKISPIGHTFKDGVCTVCGEKDPYNTDNPTPAKGYIIGDIDCDGVINSGDSLLILRRSVGLEHFSDIVDSLADVDGDGSITSADALETLRYSVGLYVTGNTGKIYSMN